MTSSEKPLRGSVVADVIHGHIEISPEHKRVIDTASFQRLRHIKQLGFAHMTYPNATHTRFAHSLGVLGTVERVLRAAKDQFDLEDEQRNDLLLAGLLHDIGHYPYSHTLEKVERVTLTEELLGDRRPMDGMRELYPRHEDLGTLIITCQKDLIEAIGGEERAQRIAQLSGGNGPDERLNKLIKSTLDMDRLDYLLRDAYATGVPYGRIDLNYLLSNLHVNRDGALGILEKAIPAAEHAVFARFFMHKAVYYHKTTFGIEEACAQLWRRLRDDEYDGVHADGKEVKALVMSDQLGSFTDKYLDSVVTKAQTHEDPVIRDLARAITNRRPPKLLKEVSILSEDIEKYNAVIFVKEKCRNLLRPLADEYGLQLGHFLICETRPLQVEKRGGRLTREQANNLQPEEEEELIKVFRRGEDKVTSLVDIPHSIVAHCAGRFFQSFRLYLVRTELPDEKVMEIQERVSDWDTPQ